jgi:hypothetical protein
MHQLHRVPTAPAEADSKHPGLERWPHCGMMPSGSGTRRGLMLLVVLLPSSPHVLLLVPLAGCAKVQLSCS